MTLLNHTAILNSHSNVVNILDEGDTTTAYDIDAKVVTIDTAKYNAAKTALDNLAYQDQRAKEYPDWGTQLDYIYHNGIDKWKTDIVDPVKKKYPKPE
tara:strand:- start:27 stop:320 length:294 start_codon:yes stop_codon:yes gene_type:complete